MSACLKIIFFAIFLLFFFETRGQSNPSVARLWNEILLESIRNDFARPTVHARNLFHISAGMYDAWAAYDPKAKTYFLGKTRGDFSIPFEPTADPLTDVQQAQETAISYFAYRLINFRFRNSPGVDHIVSITSNLMIQLGYDITFEGQDYLMDGPAALGNYLAEQLIQFGLQDGANEAMDYQNLRYNPVNESLNLAQSGNADLRDPNRWQPLSFDQFIDQAGNLVEGSPAFLGAEWGDVVPFALNVQQVMSRDNLNFRVYHDPGKPPLLVPGDSIASAAYKWNFGLVAAWSAQLDPHDSVLMDVSPNAIGNLDLMDFPMQHGALPSFYDFEKGGNLGLGYEVNPVTGLKYESQKVLRGNYTRVLAEFWADGPDSETPPGHWFTILNDVMDHPLFERKFQGLGEPLAELEWDVKAYFALGGAMQDAAISAWSIKGYYDYIRPISALRYLAGLGQSSLPNGTNYHIDGILLKTGLIEQVKAGDPLAGVNEAQIGKIKLYTWRGHDYIQNVTKDAAGVGWILAENWWPYQRPTFVTPPFAGYISGHSTYSRAAATVLTLLTGSAYFPGGMGVYRAEKNQFLKFEKGPSQDIELQWARYYDAADQCGLSRVWGGIHPPVDDISGRLIGDLIGRDAFELATFFYNPENVLRLVQLTQFSLYPNPLKAGASLTINASLPIMEIKIIRINGVIIIEESYDSMLLEQRIDMGGLMSGLYVVQVKDIQGNERRKLLTIN
tara:strand:+ start:782 stop:2971 length:2190 start_codon:yes stop_codon:yes gene_type:complete